MNYLVAKKLAIFSLLFISGCQIISPESEQVSEPVNTTTSAASGECPEQPNVVLNNQNVKAIALENEQAALSGIAKKNKSLGYIFDAKSGQNFNYQTEEDICVWIYTPSNELLTSKKIPVDGKYTIQVSAPKGSATFDLNISLKTEKLASNPVKKERNNRELTGVWQGSFGLNQTSKSTIEIFQKSENKIEGTLTTVGNKGGLYKIAIQGFIDWKTREITIQETRIISKPSDGVWFLGTNEGRLSSDFQEISGMGKDPYGNQYSWLFSKNSTEISSTQSTVKPSNDSLAINSENLYTALEVVNVYRDPSINSERVTQALHGEPAKILSQQGSWIEVMLPDQQDYQGWVQKSALKNVSSKEDWLNRQIVSVPNAKIRTFPNESALVLEDLPLGTVVALDNSQQSNDFTSVKLVDGRKGYVMAKELLDYSDNTSNVSGEKILATAKQLMGQPYLWGGMTTPGIDCSGFVHTVFKVHSVRLHRDTDLQYLYDGVAVSSNQLQPGDLVFFETYKSGASHMGIYAGNRKFLHASSSRGVNYDSLDSPYFSQRFIGAKRVIS